MAPLRIESLMLPAPDLDAVARFYRWVLQVKAAPEASPPSSTALSWGREDRIALVDLAATPARTEAIGLRMPALTLADAAAWCAERDLVPERIAASPDDAAAARAAWPGAEVEELEDEAAANRVVATVRAPFGLAVELAFPTPRELLIARRRMGPFYRKSADWSGLEIPGLLGVTTGVPDPGALRAFADRLGLESMAADDPDAPLLAGDHQWVFERRETIGVSAFAVVVSAARINDLKRTLEHLGADYRQDGNRLLTADPAGRVVLVNGVRGG